VCPFPVKPFVWPPLHGGAYLHAGQPLPHAAEAGLRRDVVHHHHRVRPAEELLGDAAVPAGGGGGTRGKGTEPVS